MKTKLKKGKITLTCEVSMSNMQVRPCEQDKETTTKKYEVRFQTNQSQNDEIEKKGIR